jgi:hypothetical protein
MFPIDPLWVYIAVPAVMISILVLIKLRQEKTGKRVASASMVEEKEEANPLEKETAGESLEDVRETQEKPESSEEKKPQDCPNYLGYLYMKKAPDRTHIPSECYSCPKLLQCLYSPHVMEKVYGE